MYINLQASVQKETLRRPFMPWKTLYGSLNIKYLTPRLSGSDIVYAVPPDSLGANIYEINIGSLFTERAFDSGTCIGYSVYRIHILRD